MLMTKTQRVVAAWNANHWWTRINCSFSYLETHQLHETTTLDALRRPVRPDYISKGGRGSQWASGTVAKTRKSWVTEWPRRCSSSSSEVWELNLSREQKEFLQRLQKNRNWTMSSINLPIASNWTIGRSRGERDQLRLCRRKDAASGRDGIALVGLL